MFIIISGPSGVGKNTIIENLMKDDNRIKYLMSCSTRQPRENQIGQGYIFLSTEQMQQKIENNELFEYEEIHGNYYGTLNSSIQDILEEKYDYIKDLGVLGQKFYKNKLKDKVKILSIYLTCTKDVIESRLRNRGETEVEKRLERFDFEESHKGNYDLVIENYDREDTLKYIKEKIKEIRNK